MYIVHTKAAHRPALQTNLKLYISQKTHYVSRMQHLCDFINPYSLFLP